MASMASAELFAPGGLAFISPDRFRAYAAWAEPALYVSWVVVFALLFSAAARNFMRRRRKEQPAPPGRAAALIWSGAAVVLAVSGLALALAPERSAGLLGGSAPWRFGVVSCLYGVANARIWRRRAVVPASAPAPGGSAGAAPPAAASAVLALAVAWLEAFFVAVLFALGPLGGADPEVTEVWFWVTVSVIAVVTLARASYEGWTTVQSRKRYKAQEELRLAGTWLLVEVDGQPVTVARRLVRRSKQFTVKEGAKARVRGHFEINPHREPKTVDVTSTSGVNKGTKIHGIYRLDGDRYEECLANPGRPRPKDFGARRGVQRVYAYRRESD